MLFRSKVAHSDNEPWVTKKQSSEYPTVVDKLESGEQVTQNVIPTDRKRRTRNETTLNCAQSKVNCFKSMCIQQHTNYMCMLGLIYSKSFTFFNDGFPNCFSINPDIYPFFILYFH